MKPLILRLVADAYGTHQDVIILTSKDKSEIKHFIDTYFDIVSSENLHGYVGEINDTYKVASYVKVLLTMSDNDIIIEHPELISKAY